MSDNYQLIMDVRGDDSTDRNAIFEWPYLPDIEEIRICINPERFTKKEAKTIRRGLLVHRGFTIYKLRRWGLKIEDKS